MIKHLGPYKSFDHLEYSDQCISFLIYTRDSTLLVDI